MYFKKITITMILLLFICFGAFSAKASYNESISIDPISLLFRTITIDYETQISKHNSYSLSALYYQISKSQGNWNGYGIGGSYRWYIQFGDLRKKPIEGLSVGPFAHLVYFSFSKASTNVDEPTPGAALTIGADAAYKWIYNQWVIEPVIALEFPLRQPEGVAMNPIWLGVHLGYAW